MTNLPPDDETRDALALSADENADLCAGCVKCCTYVTVEIDKPRTSREYDQWIWALHHTGLSLYVENPERWSLCIEAVCEKLDDNGRCGIYGRHPVLCREYDPRSCERRLPLATIRARFHSGEEFERWLEVHRPSHYVKLMAFRKDQPAGRPKADTAAERRGASALINVLEPASR